MITGNVIEVRKPDGLPDMQTEGQARGWKITVMFSDILNFVTAKTVDDAKKNAELPEQYVMKEDDRDLALVYLQEGVSNIYMVIARRMAQTPQIFGNCVTFDLTVGQNHDDNMANVLYLKIVDYLQNYLYLRWTNLANTDNLEGKLDAIRSVMHYRKHGITRKVTNLI